MYTIVIDVPFRRVTPDVCEVASDWAASLNLLRDSLQDHFGPIMVAAPELDAGTQPIGAQEPVRLSRENDRIGFVGLGRDDWRARHFWINARHVWKTIIDVARDSEVIHVGINDIWQPFSIMGFLAGVKLGKTTVFVLDGDAVTRVQQSTEGSSPWRRLRASMYCGIYERIARQAIRRADLPLLKGEALLHRYGRESSRIRVFYDTSFHQSEIIAREVLAQKKNRVIGGLPLRCVFSGRLVDIKNVDHIIKAVAGATKQGVKVTLDIYGDGPERSTLERLVREMDVDSVICFKGSRTYGKDFLREIQEYDIMLFAATAEETPRALFDGMAAGTALLAYDIPFVKELIQEFGHGICVARGQIQQLSAAIVDLDRDRNTLGSAIENAGTKAYEHAAECWYSRRAEWTFEAHRQRVLRPAKFQ